MSSLLLVISLLSLLSISIHFFQKENVVTLLLYGIVCSTEGSHTSFGEHDVGSELSL